MASIETNPQWVFIEKLRKVVEGTKTCIEECRSFNEEIRSDYKKKGEEIDLYYVGIQIQNYKSLIYLSSFQRDICQELGRIDGGEVNLCYEYKKDLTKVLSCYRKLLIELRALIVDLQYNCLQEQYGESYMSKSPATQDINTFIDSLNFIINKTYMVESIEEINVNSYIEDIGADCINPEKIKLKLAQIVVDENIMSY